LINGSAHAGGWHHLGHWIIDPNQKGQTSSNPGSFRYICGDTSHGYRLGRKTGSLAPMPIQTMDIFRRDHYPDGNSGRRRRACRRGSGDQARYRPLSLALDFFVSSGR
jgi:hypothetical protein